jgi:hypothetical protein
MQTLDKNTWRKLIVFGLLISIISFFDMGVSKKIAAVVVAGLLIVGSKQIAGFVETVAG